MINYTINPQSYICNPLLHLLISSSVILTQVLPRYYLGIDQEQKRFNSSFFCQRDVFFSLKEDRPALRSFRLSKLRIKSTAKYQQFFLFFSFRLQLRNPPLSHTYYIWSPVEHWNTGTHSTPHICFNYQNCKNVTVPKI